MWVKGKAVSREAYLKMAVLNSCILGQEADNAFVKDLDEQCKSRQQWDWLDWQAGGAPCSAFITKKGKTAQPGKPVSLCARGAGKK